MRDVLVVSIILLYLAWTFFKKDKFYQVIARENECLKQRISELEEENTKLEEFAMTDMLTGLGNKRCFESTWLREISLAKRNGIPISLLSIDADNLKFINDNNGHQAGDAFLKGVAEAIKSSAKRREDFGARWGGDEFFVILPGTNERNAAKIVEEIKGKVKQVKDQIGVECATTVSIGIASVSDWQNFKMLSAEKLCEEMKKYADDRMYEDKGNKQRR